MNEVLTSSQTERRPKRRLGGWTRLGIVATIFWIVGAWTYVTSTNLEKARNWAELEVRLCMRAEEARRIKTGVDCWKRWRPAYEMMMESNKVEAPAVALVPVPIIWFVVWLSICVGRWVRAGFASSDGT